MARWEPNATDRLCVAALKLFEERGFEQTTVAEIAARAGLTERTFFRHFTDKREVLPPRRQRSGGHPRRRDRNGNLPDHIRALGHRPRPAAVDRAPTRGARRTRRARRRRSHPRHLNPDSVQARSPTRAPSAERHWTIASSSRRPQRGLTQRRRSSHAARTLSRGPDCPVGVARSPARDRAGVAGSACKRSRVERDRSAFGDTSSHRRLVRAGDR